MTSINFNASATTALRTLQATNNALETTQNRVSTGLKIGEAKDNAAYWAISTTLKSDNKALSTVKDALGLGAATVDTAYQGLNKSLEVLDEIKSKLTAATQDGVDKTKIQAEISELQLQLRSIASASSFSGENWLSDTGTLNGTKQIVSSFTRDSSGAVSIGTIAVDADKVALFNGTSTGILDKVTAAAVGSYTDTGAYDLTAAADAVTFTADDTVTFTVTQDGGPEIQVTINKSTVDRAIGTSSNGVIGSDLDLASVINLALKDAQVTGVTASAAANTLTFKSDGAFSASIGDNGGTGDVTAAALGLGAAMTGDATGTISKSVMTVDVTSAGREEIESMIDIVSDAAEQITSQAAVLGAVATRINMQDTFVTSLIDTIDKGVSDLIDADLSEESTRLQALQTKQQLGIQALSIANAGTQNVLSLFQ